MANEFNNLVMSFEDYVNTQVSATVGADNIHFDGVDFNTENKTLWIVGPGCWHRSGGSPDQAYRTIS